MCDLSQRQSCVHPRSRPFRFFAGTVSHMFLHQWAHSWELGATLGPKDILLRFLNMSCSISVPQWLVIHGKKLKGKWLLSWPALISWTYWYGLIFEVLLILLPHATVFFPFRTKKYTEIYEHFSNSPNPPKILKLEFKNKWSTWK